MTQPKTAASKTGSLSINVPNKRYAEISAVAGTKHSKSAETPFFLKSFRLRFNPALVKMMTSASFLKSAEIPKTDGDIRFNTYGPRTIPIISIPKSGGNLIFDKIEPSSKAHKQITANGVKNLYIYSPFAAQTKKPMLRVYFAEVISFKSGLRKIFGRTSFPNGILAGKDLFVN